MKLLEASVWALLCIFVFTIPWEKTLWIAGIGTGTRLLGFLLAPGAVLLLLLGRSLRPPNLAVCALGAFVFWAGLTCAWSIDRGASAERAFTFLQLFIMLLVLWDRCVSGRQQVQLLFAYVLGALLSASLTLARFAIDIQTYYRRYSAPGFDPNDLGVTLALAIPILLFLSLRAKGWAAAFCAVSIAICCAAILLTASRTAVVAAAAGFLFAVWTWRAGSLWYRASSAALGGMFLAGALWLAPAPSRERLSTLPAELMQGSLHNRTLIWKAGLKAWKRHRLCGTGAGTYPQAVFEWLGVPAIPGHSYVAHNSFLSVLVEQGVIGLTLFSLGLTILALFVWSMAGTARALWAIILLSWIIGAFTLSWEHRKATWIVFALIMTEWARLGTKRAGINDPRT